MGLPNVMRTGRSGMIAAKTAIATAGHNITNANTEGFSRQRVITEAAKPEPSIGKIGTVGRGTLVSRVERINDEYLEKQVRNSASSLANFEEKSSILRQVEDAFNELNGDGLNRLVAKFFNDFRELSNDPDSEAVRQSVRESSKAMVNDFRRLRTEMTEARRHIDSRIDGHVGEVNSLAKEIKNLNTQINKLELTEGSPNDLLDQRDVAVKKLAEFLDIQTHKDEFDRVYVDLKDIGPFITASSAEQFSVNRTKEDEKGKGENSLDIYSTANANSNITHTIRGGKIGALLEVRDKTISTILDRLDDLAFSISESVNQIHKQGFNKLGQNGVEFFRGLNTKERASEYFDLSDSIKNNVNNIATAAAQNAPGDNRIALAISGIQGLKLMGQGTSTMDDWFNSIVSDVGVVSARNNAAMNQQKSINSQLNKIRDQISGVSIDEETANLLQFQHTFDASAKVIQVADELLDTVLNMKRF